MEKLTIFLGILLRQVVAALVLGYLATLIALLMVKTLLPLLGPGEWEILPFLILWIAIVPAAHYAMKPSPQIQQ